MKKINWNDLKNVDPTDLYTILEDHCYPAQVDFVPFILEWCKGELIEYDNDYKEDEFKTEIALLNVILNSLADK
jgi:hypothetical protein